MLSAGKQLRLELAGRGSSVQDKSASDKHDAGHRLASSAGKNVDSQRPTSTNAEADGMNIPDSWESIVTDDSDSEQGGHGQSGAAVVCLDPQLGLASVSFCRREAQVTPPSDSRVVPRLGSCQTRRCQSTASTQSRGKEPKPMRKKTSTDSTPVVGDADDTPSAGSGRTDHCVLVSPHLGEVLCPNNAEKWSAETSQVQTFRADNTTRSDEDVQRTCLQPKVDVAIRRVADAGTQVNIIKGTSEPQLTESGGRDTPAVACEEDVPSDRLAESNVLIECQSGIPHCVQYQSVQSVHYNITEESSKLASAGAPSPAVSGRAAPQARSANDLDYVSDDDNLMWEDPTTASKTASSDSDAEEFFSLESDAEGASETAARTGPAAAPSEFIAGGSSTEMGGAPKPDRSGSGRGRGHRAAHAGGHRSRSVEPSRPTPTCSQTGSVTAVDAARVILTSIKTACVSADVVSFARAEDGSSGSVCVTCDRLLSRGAEDENASEPWRSEPSSESTDSDRACGPAEAPVRQTSFTELPAADLGDPGSSAMVLARKPTAGSPPSKERGRNGMKDALGDADKSAEPGQPVGSECPDYCDQVADTDAVSAKARAATSSVRKAMSADFRPRPAVDVAADTSGPGVRRGRGVQLSVHAADSGSEGEASCQLEDAASDKNDDDDVATEPSSAARPLPCRVVITDTDANITNTLDLDSAIEYGAGLEPPSKSNIVSCASILDVTDDRHESAAGTGRGSDDVARVSTADGSTDEEGEGHVMEENECLEVYCEVQEFGATASASAATYEDYGSYSDDVLYQEAVVTSGDTCTEGTVVYTNSTVAGIDRPLYGDAQVPVLGAAAYSTSYGLGYGSDNESYMSGMNQSGQSSGSVMMSPVGVQTCPHGYPTIPSTPMAVVQSSDLCTPAVCSPDSSMLAGVYNTLAPLHCTLTADCAGRQPGNQNGEAGLQQAVPSGEGDPASSKAGDYSDLECSGYSVITSATGSHITMATIPNTTATIPAVMTTATADCNTPASPTTSLQFRVQLKEFAFVGSCLKIAAKVSVTEEDAEFWKHMHPGDVYFFSANSYVLCVQRGKQKVTTKAPGLNPNANVFHIKNQGSVTTPPSESGSADWSTSEVDSMYTTLPTTNDEFGYMNGDVDKTPPSGVATTPTPTFPPTPESPMSQADYSGLNGVVEGQALFASDAGQGHDEMPLDGNITDDQRRAMIKNQLEYYFSRENLANDSYLVSQMDADQYVSIATIASFNQVKRLTNDLKLVIEILRESVNVQVDEKGEKVRPLHKRCIVILREIPESVPQETVEKLFKSENCPPIRNCEFAHNDSWYVTFDSEEDAQKAYKYLREEVRTFLGKPIMARIKAKPLLRSSFVPKNGFKQTYEPPLFSQPQKFTPYPTVASMSYLPNQQSYPFFPPGGAAATPTAATSTIPQVWPTTHTALSYFDPGTAFAANGYTPSTTIKPSPGRQPSFSNIRHNRNQKPHRGGIASNNREQANLSQVDRSGEQERSEHREPQRDRSGGPNARTDRFQDRHIGGQAGGRPYKSEAISINNHYHNHHHHSASTMGTHRADGRSYHSHHHTGVGQTMQGHGTGSHVHVTHPHTHPHSHNSHMPVDRDRDHDRSVPLPSGSRHSSLSETNNKDQYPQPQRRGAYRSKRRSRGVDETGANRSNTSSQLAKEKVSSEPLNFELADTSFPPLPGSTSNTSSNEVFENKMSDVVKGTAKPSKPPSNTATSSSAVTATVTSTATSTSPSPCTSQALPTTPTSAPASAPASASREVETPVAAGQVNGSTKPSSALAKHASTSVKATNLSTKPNVISTTVAVPVAHSSSVTMASVLMSSIGTTPAATAAAAGPSPEKVSKSTCTDGSVMMESSSSGSGTASTSTQTCSPVVTSSVTIGTTTGTATTSSQITSPQEEKTPKKLSYAEMAQRGKAQVMKSVEKVKTDDATAKEQSVNGTTSEVKDVASAASSAVVIAPGATTNVAVNSPTHRDQPREQRQQAGHRTFNSSRRDERKNSRDGDRAGGFYRVDRRGNREYDRNRAK